MNLPETSTPAAPSPIASAPTHRVAVFRGLLWREWLAYGRTISAFITLWLVAVFALELCSHPVILLVFGMLYAIVLGNACGGGDASEGSEEFAFALPATRSQRYLARLALGGGVLMVLQVVGVTAIALDLPQMLWGLIVTSGFTEPFPAGTPGVWYWLALALPCAAFATIFAFTANAQGGATLSGSFLGVLVPGLAMAAGFMIEQGSWHDLNGLASCPALLVVTIIALLVGHRRYVRKEGISRPLAPGGRIGAWVMLALFLVVLCPMVLVFTTRSAHSVHEATRTAEIQAATAVAHTAPVEIPSGSSSSQSPALASGSSSTAMPGSSAQATLSRGMGSTMVLLALVVIVVVALSLMYHRSARPIPIHRQQERHPVVRILCAVLAGAILLAMAINSWREAVASYRSDTISVKNPSHPRVVPDAALTQVPGVEKELPSARFLLHVFIGTWSPGGFLARYHREWDVRWPDQQNDHAVSWQGDGIQVDYHVTIERVVRMATGQSPEPKRSEDQQSRQLAVRGRIGLSARGDITMGSWSTNTTTPGVISESGMMQYFNSRGGGHTSPLSIGTASYPAYALFAVVTPLTDDDVLIDQPAGEFLAPYQARLRADREAGGRTFRQPSAFQSGGFALLGHLGLASLSLVLVVVLACQCFRARVIAAAVVVVVVVISVAAIERLMVAVHLDRAADAQAPIDQRLLTGARAGESFFYRPTALRRVQALAADPTESAGNREEWARLIAVLTR